MSIGAYSSVFGYRNIASGNNQLVIGKFNEPLDNALFIVGNGTDNEHRSNALWLDKNGNLHVSGDISGQDDVNLRQVILTPYDSNLYVSDISYESIKNIQSNFPNTIITCCVEDNNNQYGYFINDTFIITSVEDDEVVITSYKYYGNNNQWISTVAGAGMAISYSLEQDTSNPYLIHLIGSDGSDSTVTVPQYNDSIIMSILNLLQSKILNVYTKDEINNNFYNKSEIDTQVNRLQEEIDNIDVDLSDYYTKTEVDNLITDTKQYIDDYFEFLDNYSEEEF